MKHKTLKAKREPRILDTIKQRCKKHDDGMKHLKIHKK